MTIAEIKRQVRWCIDEEVHYSDKENTYMDNIIVAKMSDALRWVTLNADSTLLSGSDERSKTPGILHNYVLTEGSSSADASDTGAGLTSGETEGTVADTGAGEPLLSGGVIRLPLDTVKMVRVRAEGWHRAILLPIAEDSDEYLMQSDENACATKERPVAAIVESYPPRLELFPKPSVGESVEITIAVSPPEADNVTSTEDSATIALPPKVKSSYIYYIAFLVLCALGETSKANVMLNIAKMEIGYKES